MSSEVHRTTALSYPGGCAARVRLHANRGRPGPFRIRAAPTDHQRTSSAPRSAGVGQRPRHAAGILQKTLRIATEIGAKRAPLCVALEVWPLTVLACSTIIQSLHPMDNSMIRTAAPGFVAGWPELPPFVVATACFSSSDWNCRLGRGSLRACCSG